MGRGRRMEDNGLKMEKEDWGSWSKEERHGKEEREWGTQDDRRCRMEDG